jgi:nitroalkane oxidase
LVASVADKMAIDFTLDEGQRQLQANARAFAEAVLTRVKPALSDLSTPGARFEATKPIYQEMARAGFVKALLPTEYGGTGLSTLAFAIAAEELTRVDVNVPTTLLASGLALQPLLRFGTPEQKQRFLPDFLDEVNNPLASFAFTEITGGANFDTDDPKAGVRTFARREGDEWVISGRKQYATNGTGWDGKGAHLYSVVCRTDPLKPPRESLAVILVPGGSRGVSVTGVMETLGHRAVISPRIVFEEVRVPVTNLLGRPGDGISMVSTSFAWTAALIGAACVGVMRAAFDCAHGFVKNERCLGPVPVIEHQNAGYMLADIKTRIEAARYLTWKSCHYFDETAGAGQELPIMTKIFCSELAVQVVYDAMRLVGINSYTDTLPLAGLMQDALCFPLYDGGNMGVRRRQLYNLMRHPGYDPMAALEGRPQPSTG